MKYLLYALISYSLSGCATNTIPNNPIYDKVITNPIVICAVGICVNLSKTNTMDVTNTISK